MQMPQPVQMLFVDIARFLAHGHREVAQIAIHLLHLAVGEQGDVGVLADIHHLGRQNTGRAVQRGEGLVQLGHVAANGRFPLHQIDVVPGIGQLQRRRDAGDAAAHDQGVGVDVDRQGFKRLVVDDAFDRRVGQRFGFLRGRFLVVCDPGVVLPDVGHLEQEGVQPASFAGGAEGFFVHVGRAGGDDHPRQALFS